MTKGIYFPSANQEKESDEVRRLLWRLKWILLYGTDSWKHTKYIDIRKPTVDDIKRGQEVARELGLLDEESHD